MKTEFLMTLYVFCMDYHSGQWSRGYRILSRIARMGIKLTDSCIDELRDSETYSLLVTKYGGKI